LPVLILILVLAAIAASSVLYIIDETAQVVITRFGKPLRTVTEPGLHFKAPFVDTVNVFRRQVLATRSRPRTRSTSSSTPSPAGASPTR
jgi:membrane protease subunit HflC